MKKFKRLFAAIGALAVASCSIAFTACNDNSGEQLTETQQFIQNALSATQSANYKSLNFDYSMSIEGTGSAASSNMDVSVDAVMDLATMEYDMEAVMTDSNNVTSYGYAFIRGMQLFASEDDYEAQQTDYSSIVLIPAGSYSSLGATSVSAVGDLQTVFAAATLAECYNAVTLADNSLTINTISLVKGIYDDLLEIVDALTAETTISDIYAHDLFKNVIGSIGEVISAQEAYDAALQIFNLAVSSSPSAADVEFPLPAPSEGQSLYDYIGSVLNNAEFAQAMGLGQSLGSIVLLDLINMGNTYNPVTIQDVKATISAIAQYISFDDGLTLYIDNVEVQVDGCDIVYNFSESGALSGVELECGITATATSAANAGTMQITVGVEASYSGAEAQLADLNSNLVNVGYGETMPLGEYLDMIASMLA